MRRGDRDECVIGGGLRRPLPFATLEGKWLRSGAKVLPRPFIANGLQTVSSLSPPVLALDSNAEARLDILEDVDILEFGLIATKLFAFSLHSSGEGAELIGC